MKKVDIRKEIYALFEELIGRPMTAEEHEKLKASIVSYAQAYQSDLDHLNKSLGDRNEKIRVLSKIAYKKGQDAEVLERDLLFLKELFDRKW